MADMYFGGMEENEGGDDDSRAEYICPLCAEDFDIIRLCHHIDEDHPVEAKNGVCLLRLFDFLYTLCSITFLQ